MNNIVKYIRITDNDMNKYIIDIIENLNRNVGPTNGFSKFLVEEYISGYDITTKKIRIYKDVIDSKFYTKINVEGKSFPLFYGKIDFNVKNKISEMILKRDEITGKYVKVSGDEII